MKPQLEVLVIRKGTLRATVALHRAIRKDDEGNPVLTEGESPQMIQDVVNAKGAVVCNGDTVVVEKDFVGEDCEGQARAFAEEELAKRLA